MSVRILTPQDAAAFQALRLQALREDPVAFVSSYDDERDTPLAVVAERLMPACDRAVVGTFEHDALVGLAAWHREEMRKLQHKGFVWGVFVTPERRRRGLARQMVEAVIELAREAPGIRQLNLTADAANRPAVALYQSLGFEIYGREPAAICVGGVLHDDLHMTLLL